MGFGVVPKVSVIWLCMCFGFFFSTGNVVFLAEPSEFPIVSQLDDKSVRAVKTTQEHTNSDLCMEHLTSMRESFRKLIKELILSWQMQIMQSDYL